jgi:membrane protease YdiL (CAAX protease family)
MIGGDRLRQQLRETIWITADRRPGLLWRLLAYLSVSLIVLGVAQAAALSSAGPGAAVPQAATGAIYLVAASAGVIVVTFQFRRLLDRRPWEGIGLIWSRGGLRHALLGWLVGCVLIMVVFAVEYALGWVRVEGNEVAASGVGVALDYLLGGLLLMLGVGITEELVFRGYVLQNVGEQYPLWFAALVTGALFAGAHGAQGVLYYLSAVTVSTLLVRIRVSTGSLWFPLAFHGGWNWMQTAVLGVSTVNAPEYGHALLHVSQRGPELFVGAAPMIEGGLLVIGLLLAVLLGNRLHARRAGSGVSWQARLSGKGKLIGPEKPDMPA